MKELFKNKKVQLGTIAAVFTMFGTVIGLVAEFMPGPEAAGKELQNEQQPTEVREQA